MGEFIINIDGACSGNPGDAAVGIVIRDKTNSFEEKISKYIGVGTNNIAEYSALLLGLERALGLGARKVVIRSDSELLVKQLRGDYKVKNENLAVLYGKAVNLLQKFSAFTIEHVRREFNKEADLLAKKGITDYRRANRMVAAPGICGVEESPSSSG